MSSSSMAISPALYKNLDFDITRDFAPYEFDRYLKAEVDKWAKVVKAADIRID